METDTDLKKTKKGPLPKTMRPYVLSYEKGILMYEKYRINQLVYVKHTTYAIPYADEVLE